MQVLVLSCGRTGTNMLLEILRGSSYLKATDFAEDKTLFRDGRVLEDGYLSKCDTVYISNSGQIDRIFKQNPNLRILFTVRDWRDCAMSKFYRGQPGKDNVVLADDATVNGCLEDIEWMNNIYDYIREKYPHNILTIKMEEIILDFDRRIEEVCKFCALVFEKEKMISFTDRYRNNFKSGRYNELDKSQVKLHERLDTVYNGFFKDEKHNEDIKEVFNQVKPYLEKFGYESDYQI
jgi:hypothetical protein